MYIKLMLQLKKEGKDNNLYIVEHVAWPHEAKSILMVVWYIDHTGHYMMLCM